MRTARLVIGLGYGDEGKGSWVDHLVRQHDVKYVVRFNGGAQALHHVVLLGKNSKASNMDVPTEEIVHGFSQFSSGSFNDGVYTCLSRFMLIDPESLLKEATQLEHLGVKDPFGMLIVSENAPIITPFNRLLNRIQEIARSNSSKESVHGSCGFGIGLTQGDVETLGERALYVSDLASDSLEEKMYWLAQQKLAVAKRFETPQNKQLVETLEHVDIGYYVQLFRHFFARVRVVSEEEFRQIVRKNDTVFEGAQGVLLDQDYGFFPHVTRSRCTFENAQTLLQEADFKGRVERIGLLRGYASRHGAGPFVTEDPELKLTPCHNQSNPWQGEFRLGWFDVVAARYALRAVGGVDTLALTNLDRMSELEQVKICTGYQDADSRFFDHDRIRLMEPNLDVLTERTESMDSIFAQYHSFGSFKLESYLELLSTLIGRRVDAFSDTVGPMKTYRDKVA